MQTLARHLDMAKSTEKQEDMAPGDTMCVCLPRFLVGLSGFAVGLTLVLACLKLDMIYAHIQWWVVLLPITITLGVVFLVMTMAVILWIRFTTLVYHGDIDMDLEDVRLDVILRTAKICFLGHAYVLLLALSMGLLLAKLDFFPSIPVAYPLTPLIFLAVVYIILGVVLQQPEVDSPWFLLVGTSALSQSVMLIIKLDHSHEAKSLPWATVFIPCWVTYVILLSYSALCAVWAAVPTTAPETTPETQTSTIHKILAVSPRVQCYKASGIACWAVGWGLSQVLLSLRLDAQHKVAWFAMALPALLGWILLLIFVFGPVSEYFEDLVTLLFHTFIPSSHRDSLGYESSDVEEERRPLLTQKRGVTTELD